MIEALSRARVLRKGVFVSGGFDTSTGTGPDRSSSLLPFGGGEVISAFPFRPCVRAGFLRRSSQRKFLLLLSAHSGTSFVPPTGVEQ